MSKRSVTRAHSRHHPDEDTSLDSGSTAPHMPSHFHIKHSDSDPDGAPLIDAQRDMNGAVQSAAGLGRDKTNIAVLMFLYILQGIPLGLAGSIPYLLQSRSVNYKDQAVFSFVFWPFSVKLLWAPIVDAIFIKRFGRRKSWLVPVQYLIGLFMMVLSTRISDLMGEGAPGDTPGGPEGLPGGPVNIVTLTAVFFCLNFLAATQDIVVDGWALTMLSRQNVGWASTCNSVGQTTGYFLGNVVFMALESPEFCNAYLRSEPQAYGIVTLATFLRFWGFVFFISTTLVAMIKREKEEEEEIDGVVDTYKLLLKIVRLPAVISLIIVLLTSKIGFAAADAVTGLKLIEEGVPKEKLALLAVPLVPVQIILPLLISKYTSGPQPMNMWLKAIPYRLIMGLVFALVVWWAPSTKTGAGIYPLYFYAVILLVYAIHQVTLYTMFVSQMAFHAKISDPAIGGTYMTLLNTVANLGGNWPSSVVLWLIDDLTWKTCEGATGQSCDSSQKAEACTAAGGSCSMRVDGYYIESVLCVALGMLWLLWRRRKVQSLQSLPPSSWTTST